MKILHICICGEFYEKYAYQDNLLAKYHRKLGHDVTILASTRCRFDQKSGKVIQDYTKCKYLEDGTKVIRLGSFIPLAINKHIHYYCGFKNVVLSEKPDLIFVHGVESPNYIFLSKYKKSCPEVKIVYDNHTDLVNSQHSVVTRWWARHIIRDIIVKRIIWTSDHFYGTTPKRSDFLHDFYLVPNEKISLLPMGGDDDLMKLDEKDTIRKSIREKYHVEEDEFLIVTGGKIDRKKNIHTLVEAANRIDAKIKVLVFGSIVDELKETFESLKSDKTIFIGWVSSNEVYQYFYAADLVAFPGLHSVIWEQAVASQVPTAFSKIEGFEHVNFNDNAIMFEENTVDYYETVLTNTVSNKDLYNRLKQNACDEKSKIFLYSGIARKVIEDIS